MRKISVTRDDFLATMSFKLNDITRMESASASANFLLNRGRGWNQFLELDKLFDGSLKYLDQNLAMKLAMEVTNKNVKLNPTRALQYYFNHSFSKLFSSRYSILMRSKLRN